MMFEAKMASSLTMPSSAAYLDNDFSIPAKPFVEKLLFDLEDSGVESGHCGNLNDARPHQPATQNANFFSFHSMPPSTKPKFLQQDAA